MSILPLTYYQNSDVLYLAKDLVGKYLFTDFDGVITGGMIIETEAYRGPEDRASHSFGNRRTARNEVMYGKGGISYVYMCYGIHFLFNIVTNLAEIPHAILIRAIRPEFGIEDMQKRRAREDLKTLTAGPGALCKALGIEKNHNGIPLDQPPIWLEDRKMILPPSQIKTGPRIGVDYAGEDALLPWRFYL